MILLPATDALRIGNCLRAEVTAVRMNGRNVSFSPDCFSKSARSFARMRATRVRSTSKNEVTCALVCRESDMCSAVSARMRDIGSTYSNGRLYMNLLDGNTVAIDAATGTEAWR